MSLALLLAGLVLVLASVAVLRRPASDAVSLAQRQKARGAFAVLARAQDEHATAWKAKVAAGSPLPKTPPEHVVVQLWKGDSLWHWSSNRLGPRSDEQGTFRSGLRRIGAFWCRVRVADTLGFRLISIWPIQQAYPIHNRYLQDQFHSGLQLPGDLSLRLFPTPGHWQLGKMGAQTLWASLHPTTHKPPAQATWMAALLLGLWWLLTQTGRWLRWRLPQRHKSWVCYAFIAAVVAVRLASMNAFSAPPLEGSSLFHPQLFAYSWWLPSLGDLLLNLVLLLWMAREISLLQRLPTFQAGFRTPVTILIFFGLHALAMGVSWMISRLVMDSSIPLNLLDYDQLTSYSWLAVACMGAMMLGYHLLASALINRIAEAERFSDFLLVTISTAAAAFLPAYFLGWDQPISILFSGGYILLHYLFEQKVLEQENISRSIFTILLFSLWGAQVLVRENTERKERLAKLLAEKLAQEKDQVAEFLFPELETLLQRDTLITRCLYKPEQNKSLLYRRLREGYASGYWEKYDMRFYVYDSLCNLVLKSPNAEFERLDFFERLMVKPDLQTRYPNLFYLPGSDGENQGLVARVRYPIAAQKHPAPLTLFLEFAQKYSYDAMGFPSLLLDKQFSLAEEYGTFSFGKYKDGTLIMAKKEGTFRYPRNNRFLLEQTLRNGHFFWRGYNHFVMKPFRNTSYVVSYEPFTRVQKLTITSYLFMVFAAFFVASLLLFGEWQAFVFRGNTLNARIRLVLVGAVVLALSIFGAATVLFLRSYFDGDARKTLAAGTHDLIVDLEGKLGDENRLLPQNASYYSYLLSRVANVFSNDVNLYDTRGQLVASSRPKIFEEGLVSRWMDPVAFEHLAGLQETEYIGREAIGRLSFRSVYVPFFNAGHRLLGYVHLPFFEQQRGRDAEIRSLTVTLVNLYVLLILGAALLSLWMASRITEPLKLLRNRMQRLSLGAVNEAIAYSGKDEIAALIQDYNRMVAELSQSAEKLAQSEREGAWREMARQVAHEVKNPLTPMRLSVQYLQRALKDNDPHWQEKFQKVSQTLIQQIEALNHMADAFSHFAMLPKAHVARIELAPLLESLVDLFAHHQGTEVIWQTPNPAQLNLAVNADREQLLRVFNNLIKNAVQAIPEGRQGLVEVGLSAESEGVVVHVRDNGTGISAEQETRMFVPNFTTKTGGTGLGLAMVKSLVEGMGGRVWFETQPKQGTAFFVWLPLSSTAS